MTKARNTAVLVAAATVEASDTVAKALRTTPLRLGIALARLGLDPTLSPQGPFRVRQGRRCGGAMKVGRITRPCPASAAFSRRNQLGSKG